MNIKKSTQAHRLIHTVESSTYLTPHIRLCTWPCLIPITHRSSAIDMCDYITDRVIHIVVFFTERQM